MSFLFPKMPAPPPPPPNPANPAQASIIEQGAAERSALASAAGQGFNGTDQTGGQGAPNPQTTANPVKTILGG